MLSSASERARSTGLRGPPTRARDVPPSARSVDQVIAGAAHFTDMPYAELWTETVRIHFGFVQTENMH